MTFKSPQQEQEQQRRPSLIIADEVRARNRDCERERASSNSSMFSVRKWTDCKDDSTVLGKIKAGGAAGSLSRSGNTRWLSITVWM